MSKEFRYEVEKYPAEQFIRLAYFCTEKGECSLNQVPADQAGAFEDILNKRGAEGWELVQVFFGSDGMVAIWKSEGKSD